MDIIKAKRYGAILEIVIFVSVAIYFIQKFIVKFMVKELNDDIRKNRTNPLFTIFRDLIGGSRTGETSKTGFSSLIIQKFKYVFKPFLRIFTSIFRAYFKMFDKVIGPGIQKIRMLMNPMRIMLKNITEYFYERLKNAIIGVLYTFHKMRNLMKRNISSFNLLFHTLEHTKNTFQSLLTSPQVKGAVSMLGVVEWIADIAIELGGGPESFKNTCFEGNTPVKLENGNYIFIKNIEVGAILHDGSRIIAKHKFLNEDYLFNYNDILVSGKHIVKEDNKWKRVIDSYTSFQTEIKPTYIYCISTSTGKINIKNNIFKDFGESVNKFVNYTINSLILTELNKERSYALDSCTYAAQTPNLESGFDGNTDIELENNTLKKIKLIEIGDILRDNNKVIGIIKLDGSQFDFYDDRGIIVTQNIKTKVSGIWKNIERSGACKLDYRPDFAYHLITEKEIIPVYLGKIYRDYNETYSKMVNTEIENIILNT